MLCLILGTGFVVFQSVNAPAATPIQPTKIIDVVKTDTISKQDSIQKLIVKEVETYLQKQSPKAHRFIPKYLVEAGLNHNIDICFMMAQTQLETNFGTMGAGRETSRRSLFGVAIRRYGDYETAINDYCRILNKSYLGKGRNEKHLMTKYITHSGARYAENPRYEIELSRTYNDICKKTNIPNLQKEWKKSL
jgi:flagellum-specific peptidoglycan hydrolase FlgJ